MINFFNYFIFCSCGIFHFTHHFCGPLEISREFYDTLQIFLVNRNLWKNSAIRWAVYYFWSFHVNTSWLTFWPHPRDVYLYRTVRTNIVYTWNANSQSPRRVPGAVQLQQQQVHRIKENNQPSSRSAPCQSIHRVHRASNYKGISILDSQFSPRSFLFQIYIRCRIFLIIYSQLSIKICAPLRAAVDFNFSVSVFSTARNCKNLFTSRLEILEEYYDSETC